MKEWIALIASLLGIAAIGAVGVSLTSARRPDDGNVSSDGPTTDPLERVRRIAQAIVRTFESGRPEGDYSAVAILEDGAGISYGAQQGTDASGTLDTILNRYDAAGGRFAAEIRPYLARLADNATAAINPRDPPAWVRQLVELLRLAGTDPIMQRVQDAVFADLYWRPAVRAAQEFGLVEPLSYAVIYDTWIHSGPDGVATIRRRFREVPPSKGGDERAWVKAFVDARHQWLSQHPRAAVRASNYRTAALRRWIHEGRWDLELPLHVARPRATITEEAL